MNIAEYEKNMARYDEILRMDIDEFLKPEVTKELNNLRQYVLDAAKEVLRNSI